MNVKGPFRLNRAEGKLMGVCAGLADYTGWDATWIRVGAVLATLLGGFPWTVLAYGLAVWFAKPARAREHATAPRFSASDVRDSMRDIDRRMIDVETYVASPNSRLAREIESLR